MFFFLKKTILVIFFTSGDLLMVIYRLATVSQIFRQGQVVILGQWAFRVRGCQAESGRIPSPPSC